MGCNVTGCTRSITIDDTTVCDHSRAMVIAEIGHNHAHDMRKLFSMVDSAKANGADAVKFQTRTPSEVYAPTDKPGGYYYKSDNPQWLDPVYGIHREKLELTEREWEELFIYCKAKGITAFSTPFDERSADMLNSFDVPAFKIASGDATNVPLLEHVARFGKPMIVSTGGCDEEDVLRIARTLGPTETPFALLQCSCIYPAPNDVLNLRVIESYRSAFPRTVVGLSTHSPDWLPTVGAFALGGRIFEHHYTNNREWKGTDNNFSLTPDMLSDLRRSVDGLLPALGSERKLVDPREITYTNERRKAAYWKRDLPEGHVVTEDDIVFMCPYNDAGAHPYEVPVIYGSELVGPVEGGSLV